jgi:uncharacterized protein with GYD domain
MNSLLYGLKYLSEEVLMAHYLQLVVLTDKGRKNFEENPEWIKELNKEIELMGAKVVTQYALLGQFDFVNIIEAPSDETAAKVAIKLSATGTVHPMTLAAIPLDKLIETLKKDPHTPW